MVTASSNLPKLFITGATGNVGRALVQQLSSEPVHLTAAVRNLDKAQRQLGDQVDHYHHLDFATHTGLALDDDYQAVFLVRPPQLADPKRYFEPLIKHIPAQTRVVFLSVQGADKKGYLPHAKIETLIQNYGLDHVFLRPSYFMENLVTTLKDELSQHQRIYLPAGPLQLNWVAVDDVARVAQQALREDLQPSAVEITSDQVFDFNTAVGLINEECQTQLRYESPNVIRYVIYGFSQGFSLGYILVMLLLHYWPRFEPSPQPSNTVAALTGRAPTSFRQFVRDHRDFFTALG